MTQVYLQLLKYILLFGYVFKDKFPIFFNVRECRRRDLQLVFLKQFSRSLIFLGTRLCSEHVAIFSFRFYQQQILKKFDF